MAANLIKNGCSLVVNDLNPVAVERLVGLGAEAMEPAQMGSICEIIFTMLPNGTILRDVLLGEKGVCYGIRREAPPIIIDMSSVKPEEARACASGAAEYGAAYIDAPVSGGEPKAIDGTLSIMAGGKAECIEAIRPYLLMMGSSVVHTGPTGSGCMVKLANQIIVNLTIAAVSEALVMAVKAGVDPQVVFDAIRGGLAGSTVLEHKVPKMIAGDFRPGGPLAINIKDMRNVIDTAQVLEMELPLSKSLLNMMEWLVDSGYKGEDHSAIVRYFEDLAGVTVRGFQQ